MGSTALMLSILQHQPNMVRYFLDSQADINLLDNAGVSALQLAIESKQVDIVRMLLEKPHIHCNHQDMVRAANNCFLPHVFTDSLPNAIAQRSKSMLLLALERLDQCDPDYSVVTLLLLRGVNVNLQDEVCDSSFNLLNSSLNMLLSCRTENTP